MPTFLIVSLIVLGVIAVIALIVIIISLVCMAFSIDLNIDDTYDKTSSIFAPGNPLWTTTMCCNE